MPYAGFIPSSLGFRVSYGYWAHVQQAHKKHIKGDPSGAAFRQRAFELGLEKSAQGLTDAAIRVANENIKPQSKTITVEFGNVEIIKKFQNFRQSAIGKMLEEKAAAAIIFHVGLKELISGTEGEKMAVSKEPSSGGAQAFSKVSFMSPERAKKLFPYAEPLRPKGQVMTKEEAIEEFETLGSEIKADIAKLG